MSLPIDGISAPRRRRAGESSRARHARQRRTGLRVGLGILAGAALVAFGAFVLPYAALWLKGVVWGWW